MEINHRHYSHVSKVSFYKGESFIPFIIKIAKGEHVRNLDNRAL